MDKRVLRERMRRKKRQLMIRKLTRLAMCVVAVILVLNFAIRGVILPIAHRISGNGQGRTTNETTTEVQAEPVAADPNAATRRPLKGQGDVSKLSEMTPGWHDSEDGRWYQNSDGTYYAGGFQEIDGVRYSFDENGYMQTGWVSKGVQDYYFNEDGSYNEEKKKPMLALTFDDGPGQYTDTLLDCLEENNAHATFFMLGQLVSSYPDTVKRMVELGCELGNHSWDHLDLTSMDLDSAAKEYSDTDNALIEACGQASTVARAPYGSYNQSVIDAVGKPFFMWSLDSMDWSYLDAEMDYNTIMNGDLTDGSIILMHDIHEPSVQAAQRIIPDLIERGYKLVTLSEMAEAKGVTLQNASYSDFWQSSLDAGIVAGYSGNTETSSEGDASAGESSGDISDGSDEPSDDGSYDESYDDGSSDEYYDESYDDGYYDDSYSGGEEY